MQCFLDDCEEVMVLSGTRCITTWDVGEFELIVVVVSDNTSRVRLSAIYEPGPVKNV